MFFGGGCGAPVYGHICNCFLGEAVVLRCTDTSVYVFLEGLRCSGVRSQYRHSCICFQFILQIRRNGVNTGSILAIAIFTRLGLYPGLGEPPSAEKISRWSGPRGPDGHNRARAPLKEPFVTIQLFLEEIMCSDVWSEPAGPDGQSGPRIM